MCAEHENQETEDATQQDGVVGSYELLQRQLKHASETIATLTERINRLQQETSQLLFYY